MGELAQEQNVGTPNQYATAVPMCDAPVLVTADALVHAEPALIFAVTVVVATAAADIQIRHGGAAGAGDIIQTIPAATAVGAQFLFHGEKLPNGLYIDYDATATGTLRIASKTL